jgi:CRISPR-associated protein Cas1
VLSAYEAFKEEETFHRLFGRPVPRWSLPAVQATLLARHLRGDLPAYPPYVIEI